MYNSQMEVRFTLKEENMTIKLELMRVDFSI